ncbi:ABC transporter permease [Alicyclobacillus fastidiosus]|uniref:ABC transporter permease n=1 Tax=Alicyclobacillus fastidiosus TaxID=392011 RepID=A0ABY6ZGN7_9BACL|nr:ABC transporter permease [Alicyclobacillus fastidiosus]WAH41376.1 ABC transporter permease [Alicyclobacillus fastidiosus]GMA62990.1 hypothetical protein GCM10025859_34300 [Alicyclobacillus fastidiosus]
MRTTQIAPDSASVAELRLKSKKFTTLAIFFKNSKAAFGIVLIALFALVAIFAPLLAHFDPQAIVGQANQPPTGRFWFGTTNEGQDLWSQWVWGTRTSLYVGIVAGAISTFIAAVIGIFAGYKGGTVDYLLNQLIQIFLVIPGFPLIVVISTYVHNVGPNVFILVIGLTSWSYGARMKRAQALTFAKRDFVLAAKLAGMSDFRIVMTQIFPNMLSFIFNTFIFACVGSILAEAGLEVLGIGSQSVESWGGILNAALQNGALLSGAWWWFVPPGLSIALVGLGFTFMNFALDEVANPRLRKLPKVKKRPSVEVSA